METVVSRSSELWDQQRQVLFDCVKPFYGEPLALSEGRGCWVTDMDGQEYLDIFAGILTTSLGHCHPRVVEAVQQQVARLGHVSTLYLNEPQVRGAQRLVGVLPTKATPGIALVGPKLGLPPPSSCQTISPVSMSSACITGVWNGSPESPRAVVK